MKTIKLNLMILLGILAAGSAAFGSQSDAQPKMNGKLRVTTLSPEEIRYTGKPYNRELGAYCRNYDPQINRWTTPDPCGFPDGANNRVYAPVPTSGVDYKGCYSIAYAHESWTVSFSFAVFDPGSLISNTIAQSWRAAITDTWAHTGTDRDTSSPLTYSVNITKFLYDTDPINYSLTALRNNFDFVVQVQSPGTRSNVYDHDAGYWASDDSTLVIAHEAGHLMKAPDEYNDVNGSSVPKSGWGNSLMGWAQSPITKDWTLVLTSNGKTSHLFE